MTPGYRLRSRWYDSLLRHPEHEAGRLRYLIDADRIGAVVLATAVVPRLAPAFEGRRAAIHRYGEWSVVHID